MTTTLVSSSMLIGSASPMVGAGTGELEGSVRAGVTSSGAGVMFLDGGGGRVPGRLRIGRRPRGSLGFVSSQLRSGSTNNTLSRLSVCRRLVLWFVIRTTYWTAYRLNKVPLVPPGIQGGTFFGQNDYMVSRVQVFGISMFV